MGLASYYALNPSTRGSGELLDLTINRLSYALSSSTYWSNKLFYLKFLSSDYTLSSQTYRFSQLLDPTILGLIYALSPHIYEFGKLSNPKSLSACTYGFGELLRVEPKDCRVWQAVRPNNYWAQLRVKPKYMRVQQGVRPNFFEPSYALSLYICGSGELSYLTSLSSTSH